MRIYKYPIKKDKNAYGDLILEMPVIHQILDIKEQDDVLCIWAIVHEETEVEKRHFRIVATGDPVVEGLVFVKTFYQGVFVWHLFQDFRTNR